MPGDPLTSCVADKRWDLDSGTFLEFAIVNWFRTGVFPLQVLTILSPRFVTVGVQVWSDENSCLQLYWSCVFWLGCSFRQWRQELGVLIKKDKQAACSKIWDQEMRGKPNKFLPTSMLDAVGMENQSKDCKSCSAERSSEPAPAPSGEVETPNADRTLPCLQVAETAPVSGHPPTPGASPARRTPKRRTPKRTPQEVWEASFSPEELLPWVPSDLVLSTPTKDLCYICLEDMNSGTIVRVIGCGHSFHLDCIILWLKLNMSCPTCRATVH